MEFTIACERLMHEKQLAMHKNSEMQGIVQSINDLWVLPLTILAVIVLLYRQIQWATFVGIGMSLLLLPVSALMGARTGRLRQQVVGWTDKRVTVMSQIIAGIRIIKMYTWELSFKCALDSHTTCS